MASPRSSLELPTEADHAIFEQMLKELDAEFPNETDEGMALRKGVLQELNDLVKDYNITVKTFGSYRLGVVYPGNDMDILCIGPPDFQRKDFFTSLVEKLRQHKEVTKCVPIPGAYTPVISLTLRGVCIDLLYAVLTEELAGSEMEEVLRNEEVLMQMEPKSVRSINGFRVADKILQLVPNDETFRHTLRFVKYWAKRRGIYSNVLGFFGGVTWSLMVANVCTMFPECIPSQLVRKFFGLYHNWQWPQPVLLGKISERKDIQLKVWNPATDPGMMPVITPVFPAMNSTHNVSETTKRIIIEELCRGHNMVKEVDAMKATWSQVCEPLPFFDLYKEYWVIEAMAKTEEANDRFGKWVESRLRIFVMELETCVTGKTIHPHPKLYDVCSTDPEWPFGWAMFVAIEFKKELGAKPGQFIDFRPALKQLTEATNQWREPDEYRRAVQLRVQRVERPDVPDYAKNPEAALLKRKASSSQSPRQKSSSQSPRQKFARRSEEKGPEASASSGFLAP